MPLSKAHPAILLPIIKATYRSTTVLPTSKLLYDLIPIFSTFLHLNYLFSSQTFPTLSLVPPSPSLTTSNFSSFGEERDHLLRVTTGVSCIPMSELSGLI